MPVIFIACAPRMKQHDDNNGIVWDQSFCHDWPDFHAVLVVNQQGIQYERYCRGEDWRLGEYLGEIVHGRNTLHDTRSISKTVTALLIGIAIDEGQIDGIEQPLYQLLPPQYAAYLTGKKQQITLRHALTMSAGMAWDEETFLYSNTANDERQMSASEDPVSFVLQRPLVSESGSQFTYHGGMTHLLKTVLENATGYGIREYAEEKLFTPLGIKAWQWLGTGHAKPSAYAGLRLNADSLHKIAKLVLNQGRWHGIQVVPENWINETLKTQINFKDDAVPDFVLDNGYGYQVWTNTMKIMNQTQHVITAMGNGGQRIIWYPQINYAVVILAGSYNEKKMVWLPEQMVAEWLMPNVINPLVFGVSRY